MTDYGEDISAHNHEYLSIRVLKPAPYKITFDVERYIADTCAHFFPGGVHASYAVPARMRTHRGTRAHTAGHAGHTAGHVRYNYAMTGAHLWTLGQSSVCGGH